MNKKEFLSRPKYRRLPQAEKERRWKQHLLTQNSKSRVQPGKSYKQALVQRPRPPKKKPQPMKKTSKPSGNSSKADRAFGLTTGSRLRATKGHVVTWQPLPMYKGPQGSYIYPMQFQAMIGEIACDGSGNLSYSRQIKGDIWPQIALEAQRFRRCRLRQCMFELLPKVGLNTNGTATQLFNYSGVSTVPTMAAAAEMQQSVPEIVPYKSYTFHWRAQDNKDSEFVPAVAAVVFNPTGHYFILTGSGLGISTKMWDLYASAVVDFTEMYS